MMGTADYILIGGMFLGIIIVTFSLGFIYGIRTATHDLEKIFKENE